MLTGAYAVSSTCTAMDTNVLPFIAANNVPKSSWFQDSQHATQLQRLSQVRAQDSLDSLNAQIYLRDLMPLAIMLTDKMVKA